VNVFEYFSDHEQDMTAEAEILEHEARCARPGTCRACLRENQPRDSDGLCAHCVNTPARAQLLPLLAPLQLRGTAQGI
jgi:hypothetical protein